MSLRRRRKPPPKQSKPDEGAGRKADRIDAPDKDHVHMSTEERLIERLRRMQLPEPPPGVRERSLERYKEWLNSQSGRNRWRDD